MVPGRVCGRALLLLAKDVILTVLIAKSRKNTVKMTSFAAMHVGCAAAAWCRMARMEMAISEISLVVFTAIAPAGAVGYIIMALVARFMRDAKAGERCDRFLVISLLLTLVGLVASATHLGTPANALYVITGLGRSPLSNEVASAAAFLALGGAYWILSFPYRQRTVPKTALFVASAAAAVAFVHFVSRAYAVESIITWDNPLAPLTQWACAIAAGSMVALAGLHAAQFPMGRKLPMALIAGSGVAAVLCVCLLVGERQIVSGMRTVTVDAADMAPLLAAQIGAFVALVLAGIACAWGSGACARREKASSTKGLRGRPRHRSHQRRQFGWRLLSHPHSSCSSRASSCVSPSTPCI